MQKREAPATCQRVCRMLTTKCKTGQKGNPLARREDLGRRLGSRCVVLYKFKLWLHIPPGRKVLDSSFICPGCNNSDIAVLYSYPASYFCRRCDRALIDENDPGLPQLTEAEAMSKRPGMYGKRACRSCGHGQHALTCDVGCRWCIPRPPHVYKFRFV